MLEIEETKTDTGGQDARRVCAGLVNGAPSWKRSVREDLRTFVPSRRRLIPLSPRFLKFLKEGGVFIKKNRQFRGVRSVAASLFVVRSLLAGQVTSVRAIWARIAVRVAGSWIAASGLFMLGWVMQGVS
jgi:hypothetical protein